MTENWQCGECSRVEKDDNVLIKSIPKSFFLLWYFMKLLFKQDILELQENLNGEKKEIDVKISVRCHHCGKPLCQKHRILISDDAFGLDEEKVRDDLPDWWSKNIYLKANKRLRNLEDKIILLLANYHPSYRKQRQKAYHCKKCWQEYHLTAIPEPDNEKV